MIVRLQLVLLGFFGMSDGPLKIRGHFHRKNVLRLGKWSEGKQENGAGQGKGRAGNLRQTTWGLNRGRG